MAVRDYSMLIVTAVVAVFFIIIIIALFVLWSCINIERNGRVSFFLGVVIIRAFRLM